MVDITAFATLVTTAIFPDCVQNCPEPALKLSEIRGNDGHISQSILNGDPLIQVEEAMRHNSIKTTMIYAHSLDRVSNGAERYVKFPGDYRLHRRIQSKNGTASPLRC